MRRTEICPTMWWDDVRFSCTQWFPGQEKIWVSFLVQKIRENNSPVDVVLSSCTEDQRTLLCCSADFLWFVLQQNQRNRIATVQATYCIAHSIISTITLAHHSVMLSSCNLLWKCYNLQVALETDMFHDAFQECNLRSTQTCPRMHIENTFCKIE